MTATDAPGAEPSLTFAAMVAARVRMPLLVVSVVACVVTALTGWSGWLVLVSIALYALAMSLYLRVGTPRGQRVDIGSPVDGRWLAVNSPSTKVPSHGLHGWAQTHACDLVAEPEGVERPGMSWWPVARRPEDFPAFGAEISSPADGVVVRSVGIMRDHWSRTSPLGMVWLVVEMLRELFGPVGILGNHVVIERDDGCFVLLAHLQRGSLRVGRGDRVEVDDVVARCGNSGNSTEPHLHVQVMDRSSVWIAAGLPFTIEGHPPPANDDHLVVGRPPPAPTVPP